MVGDFHSWLSSSSLNEGRHVDYRASFLEMPQKPGDMVFFGIHLINQFYQQNRKFPSLSIGGSDAGRIDILPKSSPVLEVDPVSRSILVQPKVNPKSMGYRDPRINRMDRKGRVTVPVDQLEDVTFMLPPDMRDAGGKLWVIISNQYQHRLIGKIRRMENERFKEITPTQHPMDQRQITDRDIAAVRGIFNSGDDEQPEEDMTDLRGKIFGMDQEPKKAPLTNFMTRRAGVQQFRRAANEGIENDEKKFWKYF